jgi:hypothetical protein
MPSAVDQMIALQQQQAQLPAGSFPVPNLENPALGFGAGMLKGPGPVLRSLQGGVPTGVERATRVRPTAPAKHEVLEFPQGGQSNPEVNMQVLLRAIDESLSTVDKPTFLKLLAKRFREASMTEPPKGGK